MGSLLSGSAVRRGVASALLLTVGVACHPFGAISGSPTPQAPFDGFPDTPVVPSVGASSAAAIAAARADSLRIPYTAADVEFMSGMVSHHSQAVAMARLAPTRAGSETIRTLAARIINAQQDEIAIMQTWLADRQQPVPPANPNGMLHEMAGMTHTMLMPGMLTAEQVRALGRSKGAEFDGLFLRYMIQHHRGATEMVRQLFATPGAGENDVVFKFASDVNVDQTTEIARMELLLVTLVVQGGLP
ncbi:MAG: hypothetical protein RL139_358 [Gemmatimonadota bacterium]|jgi:uncharacterized protein (DUF305 family)